jgi:ELWxxDGT repeat protein
MRSLVDTDRRRSRRTSAAARFVLTLSWAFFAAAGVRAQSPTLVKDIYPGVSATDGASVGFGQIVGTSGGRAFLWGFRESTQDGLWVTDGGPAGTRQILSGPLRGAGAGTDLNGTFYFGASTPEGATLWESDGTAAGTSLVKLVPAWFGDYSSLVVTKVGGRLFFTVDDDVRGTELWASDGTPVGTALVKRLTVQPGPCSYTAMPVGVGGTLFFACESTSGEALWKSDGTDAGTVPIATFVSISSMVGWNGSLYLSASDAAHGSELWKSDGTPGGTILVKDFVPGPASSNPSALVPFGGALYFRLRTDADGSIWKSDGTDVGTVLVHSLPAGGGLVPNGDRLFFSTGGTQLWASNGSTGGATLVRDFQTTISLPDSAAAVPGTLLFWVGVYQSAAVTELWKSDGTPAGTSLVKVVPARADRGGLEWPSNFGYTSIPGAFLTVFDSGACLLWGSDGTPAGTVPLVSTVPAPNSGFPGDLTDVNGTLFFSASDAEHGRELWRSDGSPGGTVLVKDLEPGPAGSSPTQLFGTKANLFFRAGTPATGERLYRTDGTDAGTLLLEDDCPQILGLLGEILIFVGNDGAHGQEPFRSDGTPGGTFPLGDLTPGLASTTVAALGALNGSFYFLTLPSDPAGTTLWKTDGTVGGTVSVRPMAGHRVWYPARAAAAGGVLVFTCEDAAYNRELWRTDGTAAGTSILFDTVPVGVAGKNDIGQSLAPLGDRIVFWADDGVHGFEPWITDGTPTGTSLLKDVNPGPMGSSNPAGTASTGSTLFFAANDGVHGSELWKTDGTGTGTTLVRDIVPGPIGSITTETFAAAGHEVFFVADDQASGRELWRTNGTEAGTARTADLDPGPASGALADFSGRTALVAQSGGRLYFTATDGTTGYELWSFRVPTGFHTFVPCPSRPHP